MSLSVVKGGDGTVVIRCGDREVVVSGGTATVRPPPDGGPLPDPSPFPDLSDPTGGAHFLRSTRRRFALVNQPVHTLADVEAFVEGLDPEGALHPPWGALPPVVVRFVWLGASEVPIDDILALVKDKGGESMFFEIQVAGDG